MNFDEIVAEENQYLMSTYGRFPVVLESGQGCTLTDIQNKKYLDLTSGIGVNSLGHNHPEIVKTIESQAKKCLHVSNLYYTQPMIEVAKFLVEKGNMKKVFFANSGAEANEGMIKVARKYSFDKYGKNRNKILTLKQSFHGRTMATLTATGQDKFHNYFYTFMDGFDYIKANDIGDLYDHLDDSVCGIMMELVQGESGVIPLDYDYVSKVACLCKEKDILLMVDEVQTGIGRCGTLFVYEQYDIQPDLVSLAKGLGSGIPVGAFMASEKCKDVLSKGDHGTTFGGNPLSCAVAKTVLSIVSDPSFLQDVKKKGEYFMEQIQKIDSKIIKEVRGKGLMIGIVVDENQRMSLINQLLKDGLLVLSAGKDVIRLLPPLIITYEQINEAIEKMKGVFL